MNCISPIFCLIGLISSSTKKIQCHTTPSKSLYHGDTLPRQDFGVCVSVYTGTQEDKKRVPYAMDWSYRQY